MPNIFKNFYLLSFFPAIAYWYLESYYPLNIAVTGGIILAVIEISCEKLFTKHVHSLSVFNLFVILSLGIIALIGQDGIWFKLQPFFTGIAICIFLTYKLVTGQGLMFEMMNSFSNKRMPLPILRMLETHFALFTFLYSLFMAYVAFYQSTGRWIFFKTAGFYLSFVIFMIFELFLIRRKINHMISKIDIKDGKRF